MKRFGAVVLFVFFAICSVNKIYAYSIEVGGGTIDNQHLPSDPHYNYSMSETIYSRDYFNSLGSINSISYQYSIESPNPASYINDVSIYMGYTDGLEFATNDDWIDTSSLELVFEGELTANNFSTEVGEGWLNIDFQTDFEYTENNNLAVVFVENREDYASTSDNFLCFETQANTSLAYCQFDSLIDVNNLVNGQFLRNYLPNTKFEFEPSVNCPLLVSPTNNLDNLDIAVDIVVQANEIGSIRMEYQTESISDVIEDLELESISNNQYRIVLPEMWCPSKDYTIKFINALNGLEYPSEEYSLSFAGDLPHIDLITTNIGNDSISMTWFPSFVTEDECVYMVNCGSESISCNATSYTLNLNEFDNLDNIYVTKDFIAYTCQSNSIEISPLQGAEFIINDDFQSYQNGEDNLGVWQSYDLDQANTVTFPWFDFENEGSHSGFFIIDFNSLDSTLNINNIQDKSLVSVSANNGFTEDLLISPDFRTQQLNVMVWLRSLSSEWGYDRIKTGIYLNNDSSQSVEAYEMPYIEITPDYSLLNFEYSVSGDDMITNFWLKNCSNQASMIMIDRISLSSYATENASNDVEACNLRIYPNPLVDNKLAIKSEHNVETVELYNLRGQLVKRKDYYANSKEVTFDVDLKVAEGVYIIKVSGKGSSEVTKVLIVK